MSAAAASGRVLVAGIYLAERENNAEAVIREMGRSRCWQVEQRWVAIGGAGIPEALTPFTAWRTEAPEPKFPLLNRLLAGLDLGRYDFVVVSDDDIEPPEGFLDRYLEMVSRYRFALAQPARSHDSFIDHPFVEQRNHLQARRTRFVEIGPLFSIRRDALPLLVPFSEESPMGWGYDFAWPVALEKADLRLGIVDAMPIAHKLRKSAAHYDHDAAWRAMDAYLAGHPHLTRPEAFSIVEAYPY